MAESFEAFSEGLEKLERKVDGLSSLCETKFEQIDRRFEQIDRRFEQMFLETSEHFTEQRTYSEFLFERMNERMNTRFDGLERSLERQFARLALKLDRAIGDQTPRRQHPPRLKSRTRRRS